MISKEHRKVLLAKLQQRFECERCGNCCHLDPTTVTIKDVEKISKFLNMPALDVIANYLKPHSQFLQQYSMRINPSCHFYDIESHGCRIYPARPEVCANFPFLSQYRRFIHQDNNPWRFYGDCPGIIKLLKVSNKKCSSSCYVE